MSALRVERYEHDRRKDWDQWIRLSKNGTFLLLRDFMEYHADRFTDCSLMVWDDRQLVAVLPASIHEEPEGRQLRSHGGLTYGGLIVDSRMGAQGVLTVLEEICHFARRELGVKSLLYKAIPSIYHKLPSQEDLYALFRLDAQLVRRDVASTVKLASRLPLTKGRKWAIKQGRSHGIQVQLSSDWSAFMEMEAALLMEKYGVRPVHTGGELAMLAARLAGSIALYTATLSGELLGGTVIFDCGGCVHAQYISSTPRGRELCALDALFSWLLDDVYASREWFDFGISTEQSGRYLNSGLAANKESWGARSVVYDQYLVSLT